MIILDTNVLSALMLDRPSVEVAEWLDRQPYRAVWTTSITVFEIRFGLNSMPDGGRRTQRIATFERILSDVFEERFSLFDSLAAELAAELAAHRLKTGRPGELRDTMIAGIVLANHATLATRNVRHFEDIAKSVVNPWEPESGAAANAGS
jgi:predicted nucleic acid-binding protein